YTINNFSAEEIQYKSSIAISVLEDYVLMVDVCNWVNKLINTSNSNKDAFWDVENKINGIKTLFLMGFIVREDHQEILERIAYDIAIDTLDGDKNDRALKIRVAMDAKLRELQEDL
ncbi:hypothetical protein OAC51_00825, partial [Flavobacteriaceae bacterium]|nr:hypothetical protein [Flavobacteriaceae bacterium]